jgi:hypothetical protein
MCVNVWDVMQYLACNRERVLPKLVEVREVVVIYHIHHEMFYHMVQDQFYRLLALVPYLRQHPDIHIFLYGRSDWADSFSNRFFQLCGISKYTAPFFLLKTHMSYHQVCRVVCRSRVIFSSGQNDDVSVKADVIYYVQELSRHETSALGFAQQIRSQLWNLLALPPDHRPWSALLEPAKRGPVEDFFAVDTSVQAQQGLATPQATPTLALGLVADQPLEINVVVMVRTDHWRGRIVVNHDEMKTALLELATTFPDKLLERTRSTDERTEVAEQRERYIKINYKEHWPETPLHETLALYAQADFVIGPHGAGTWL